MTYIVSGGALNSTHSLTHALLNLLQISHTSTYVQQSSSTRTQKDYTCKQIELDVRGHMQ